MPITVLSYSGVIDHFAAACPVELLDKPKVQKDSKNRHIGFGLDFQDKQKVLFFALWGIFVQSPLYGEWGTMWESKSVKGLVWFAWTGS